MYTFQLIKLLYRRVAAAKVSDFSQIDQVGGGTLELYPESLYRESFSMGDILE